ARRRTLHRMNTRLDLANDRHRVLAPRVIGGHHDAVGAKRSRASHPETFPPIAISAAAEYDDQSAGRERSHGVQDGRERLFSVRVVDEHGEGLRCKNRLQPTGNAPEALDAGSDGSVVKPE